MDPEEQRRKIVTIALLPPDQIDAYAEEAHLRGYFPGELAALMQRRTELKIKPKQIRRK